MVRTDRPKRSMLYMPGNNPNMLQNCAFLGADGVLLDLEDAVDESCKVDARRLVAWFLREMDFGNTIKTVRINGRDTEWFEDDLKEIIPCRPDAVRLPKCCGPEDVLAADRIISEIERKNAMTEGTVELHVMLETASGVEQASAIAGASQRVTALHDLAADMGVERTKEGNEILYARSRVVLAAKSRGIDAYDTVFTDIDDKEGLLAETRLICRLGFTGKAAIHPSQIEVIHEGFMPDEKKIDHALRVVEAAKDAKRKGIGAYKVDGKMVDGPIVRQAMHILSHAGIAVEGDQR